MVVTVDSCQGPRAYAGVVASYHELLADGLTRHTDEEWKSMVYQPDLPQVPWLEPVLAR
jgi:protoheme ferro-lyase